MTEDWEWQGWHKQRKNGKTELLEVRRVEKQMENAKLELEGGSKRGIKAERDSEREDRVEEKSRVRGQGQENKNILSFFWQLTVSKS